MMLTSPSAHLGSANTSSNGGCEACCHIALSGCVEIRIYFERRIAVLKQRWEQHGLAVVPILCKPCDWLRHPWIASLQLRPTRPSGPWPLSECPEPEIDNLLRGLCTEIAEWLSRSVVAEIPKYERLQPERIYLDKLPLTYTNRLVGREQELTILDLVFADSHTAVMSIVAWGGVGKTALVRHWLNRLQSDGWLGAQRVYAWSFYSQGTREDRQVSEGTFLAHALEWFGRKCDPRTSPWDKGRLLADAIAKERTVLVLDGLNRSSTLQVPWVGDFARRGSKRCFSG